MKSLALVVATHASRDHHGGLADVLRSFPVAALLDGGDGSRDPAYRAVLAAAAERGVRRIAAVAPLRLALGRGLTLEVLSPPPRPRGPPPEDPNPRAVVAVLSAGGFDLLLSGDAESEALLPLDLPDVNAMKVPHHGSADPGLADVLDAAAPRAGRDRGGPEHLRSPDPVDAGRAATRRRAHLPNRPPRQRDPDDQRRRHQRGDRALNQRARPPPPHLDCEPVPELKPAYLICGDDDAKIDAWRARVRRRAEEERGPGGLEVFDARSSEPGAVAAALTALTFDPGTRYVLVDDAGAWKAAELAPLEAILADMPPDSVLVAIVRGKALKQLSKAIEKAGGEVREYAAPKAWELPKWAIERARELGLQLDSEAAKELVALVGTSQQRLSRELEKIALALHPRTNAAPRTWTSWRRATRRPAPTTSPTPWWRATCAPRWR